MSNENEREQEPGAQSEVPESTPTRWSARVQRLRLFARLLWSWIRQGQRRVTARLVLAWKHPRTKQVLVGISKTLENARASGKRWRPSLGRNLRRLLLSGALFAAVTLVTLGVARYTLRTIDPGQVGVRYSKWDGDGVSMRDFSPGLHLSVPGVHKWYSLPAGTKVLHWAEASGEASSTLLDVRTLDGTSVQLSLTIPFSILPDHAHLLVARGLRTSFAAQARAKAEQVLMNSFSTLRSEQFSQTEVRRQLLTGSLEQLNQSLAEVHLQAEAILLDRVVFSSAYEKKLVETQRERQKGRVLVARRLEDQEQQTTLRKRAEIDQQLLERRIELEIKIEQLRAVGQLKAAQMVRAVTELELKTRADADRDYAALVAQAEADLALANQLKTRLHGEILGGQGGPEYLALQAARATRFGQVIMNSNDDGVPNPLNIEEMTAMFGLTLTNE
jgi:hypothetical protein